MLLEVTDKITLEVEITSKKISNYLVHHKKFICNETQSKNLNFVDDIRESKQMQFTPALTSEDIIKIKYSIIKI